MAQDRWCCRCTSRTRQRWPRRARSPSTSGGPTSSPRRSVGTSTTSEAFDAASDVVRIDDVEKSVFVSDDLGAHADHLNELAELGFDEIYLHHVGQTQEAFIEAFGSKVLPQLDVTVKAVESA